MRNTFKVYERLKREQHIKTLFQSGKAFSVFPVRALVLHTPRNNELSAVRAGFSAPKKKFSKSVDRQRVKRLMREAWRVQKGDLYTQVPEDKQLQIFFLYLDKTLPELSTIQLSFTKLIQQIALSLQPPKE